jgi:hypothetical protein
MFFLRIYCFIFFKAAFDIGMKSVTSSTTAIPNTLTRIKNQDVSMFDGSAVPAALVGSLLEDETGTVGYCKTLP